VLFKGRIYPQDKLDLVSGDIDNAIKTMKFCNSCYGISSCKMKPPGLQCYYDEKAPYSYPYFRFKRCNYWHEIQQQETVKPRFRQRTFDNFEVTNENRHAFMVCQKYASEFNRVSTKGLLLAGPYGTGKTHLVTAIHREVLAKDIASVFVNMPNLVDELIQSFKSNSESITYTAALEKRLVIIDDLGAERLRDWVQEYIYRLINERYEKMLPLVVTTNCGIKELETRIGGPAVDRLAEMCEIVPLEGKSWRRRRA
jgi:DNA replication protein DnaC